MGQYPVLASLVSISMLVAFSVLISSAQARNFLVGSKTGTWKDNQWAQTSRFQIGDYLVWEYDGKENPVLHVTREAYIGCNTTSPIEEYRDGETNIRLDHSGPYFFISGEEGQCEKGQKLIVVVMAKRSTTTKHGFGVSPAPSPSEIHAPAVAPASGAAALMLKGSFMVAALAVLAGFFVI
ncbi:hypothetical protein Dimus_011248 [Dionaea muscipula]